MKLNAVRFSLVILALHYPNNVARPVDVTEAGSSSSLKKVVSGTLSPFKPGFISVLGWLGVGRNPPPTRVKVNVVGLGRTGTTSLAVAMDILGFNVVHDDETPRLWDFYRDYYNGKINEDEMHIRIGLRGYDVSFKSNTYQWAARHDDVKVILTLRDDPNKWVQSWLKVAYLGDLLEKPPFSWVPAAIALQPLRRDIWKNIPTGGYPDQYLNATVLRKGYDVHIENVRRTVPKERLLEYNVKHGWDPLCRFLEVPIPDVSFPHVNDKIKVRGMMLCYEIITVIFSIWPVYLIYLCALAFFRKSKPDVKAKAM